MVGRVWWVVIKLIGFLISLASSSAALVRGPMLHSSAIIMVGPDTGSAMTEDSRKSVCCSFGWFNPFRMWGVDITQEGLVVSGCPKTNLRGVVGSFLSLCRRAADGWDISFCTSIHDGWVRGEDPEDPRAMLYISSRCGSGMNWHKYSARSLG